MSKTIIGNIILYICLILAQVLICNHIVLFNVAIPIIFIYLTICLPINLNVNWVLTISFLLGVTVDIFSDTPGINALACTLTSMIRKPILFSYVNRDDRTEAIDPSISTLGIGVYSKYLLTYTLIYCILIFSIEFFSFANIKEIAIMSVSSAILSYILMLGIDSLVTSIRESVSRSS